MKCPGFSFETRVLNPVWHLLDFDRVRYKNIPKRGPTNSKNLGINRKDGRGRAIFAVVSFLNNTECDHVSCSPTIQNFSSFLARRLEPSSFTRKPRNGFFESGKDWVFREPGDTPTYLFQLYSTSSKELRYGCRQQFPWFSSSPFSLKVGRLSLHIYMLQLYSILRKHICNESLPTFRLKGEEANHGNSYRHPSHIFWDTPTYLLQLYSEERNMRQKPFHVEKSNGDEARGNSGRNPSRNSLGLSHVYKLHRNHSPVGISNVKTKWALRNSHQNGSHDSSLYYFYR